MNRFTKGKIQCGANVVDLGIFGLLAKTVKRNLKFVIAVKADGCYVLIANMDNFHIHFNRNRQWITVTIWDVHPTTFNNWGGGRWAYFQARWENPKSGFFGELHLVKSGIRDDTVAHEMFHVLCEIIYARRDAITTYNEEKYASLLDELVRKFRQGYKKKG